MFLSSTPNSSPKPLLFGRDSELKQVLDSINNNEKSITL